jgi:hypothetical protein
MPITIQVEGNLDSSVIPQIKQIAEKVMGEINSIMLSRGYKRNALTYSV